MCCAFTPFFFYPKVPTPWSTALNCSSSPLIGVASVEVQLSNQESLPCTWYVIGGNCSTPPDLQLTDYKSHAIHSAGPDIRFRLPPPSCSTFSDCNSAVPQLLTVPAPFCVITVRLRFLFYHNCGVGSGILRSKIQICLFS